MIHTLASPTKIAECARFDAAALERAVLYAAGAEGTVLCIVDPRPMAVRDEALAAFARRRKVVVLDRVVPNPAVEDIMAMAERGRELKPAAVLGIGGGSTLDSAKAVDFLLANGGDLDEYLGPEATRKGEGKGCPLILVPTTTGTGSEVTKFGVYTSRTGRKYTLNSPLLQADAALLCDELVAELPAPLVAATGFDALTHALETLWNRNATAVSDLLAEDAAAAILADLEAAWREAAAVGGGAGGASGPGGAARARLLRAACAAGVAFNRTGTAAIHALSFIVSEEWHASHGEACAFFAEEVYDANCADAAVAAKLARLARRALALPQARDAEALAALRERIVELKALMGLPSRFADLKGFVAPAGAAEREALTARFDKAQGDFKMKNNPVALDARTVRAMAAEKLR